MTGAERTPDQNGDGPTKDQQSGADGGLPAALRSKDCVVNDLKRVSVIAILFLVILRLAIGWHFLYEGLWKYSTFKTNNPWSAEGYLKAAQGPFRDQFRNMTGDPDDLNWLDYEKMSDKWDRWAARFNAFYGLSESQQAQLSRLLDPAESFKRSVKGAPAVLQSIDPKLLPPVLKYDDVSLVATGPITGPEFTGLERALGVKNIGTEARKDYVLANEFGEEKLDAQGNPIPASPEMVTFLTEFDALRKMANNLTFRQKLKASLAVDPDRIGVIWDPKTRAFTPGTAAEKNDIVRYGEIQSYKDTLKEYEAALKQAKIDYQLDHAERIGKLVAEKRAKLVGPVRALETEFKNEAMKLLTAEQMAKGALPPENTPLHRASSQAMWGLLILGPLLILGLCTRLAAVAGAVMVLSFYLVVPPFPGVPQPPGPEHSFVVNKNLIEVLALLAIAALPTGTWFGIDGIFYRLFRRPTVAEISDPKRK